MAFFLKSGDGRGWHRAPVEAVAYKLNLMLGMDRVPPVAYRTGGIDVDFQHYEEGAFIYFSDNCSELQVNCALPTSAGLCVGNPVPCTNLTAQARGLLGCIFVDKSSLSSLGIAEVRAFPRSAL